MAHAFLSPSGAPAWMQCNAKPWREKGLPDQSSEAADEGTAAHFLRDTCLRDTTQSTNTAFYIGRTIGVYDGFTDFCDAGDDEPRRAFTIDADMAREVQKSVTALRKLAVGGVMYSEQELSIEHITGEPGAKGTVDTTIINGNTALVDDLKFGKGVPVFAEENEQALIYTHAAIQECDVLGEVDTVTIRISQPRMDNDNEWTIPVSYLNQRIAEIKVVAAKILAGPEGLEAIPGEKQCRFCKAKGNCAEYTNFVLGTVADDFVDLTKGEMLLTPEDAERVIAQAYGVKPNAVHIESPAPIRFSVVKPNIRPQLTEAIDRITSSDDSHLATCMDAVDMIEGWCKAVRAEVERRLLDGSFSDGRYKLVEGKRGARAWTSEEEAEATLKAMRLKVDQMYDMKLISPTSAEKVLKESNPRKWAKLQPLIKQAQGKDSVAPASDKRPALTKAKALEQFENLDYADDLV